MEIENKTCVSCGISSQKRLSRKLVHGDKLECFFHKHCFEQHFGSQIEHGIKKYVCCCLSQVQLSSAMRRTILIAAGRRLIAPLIINSQGPTVNTPTEPHSPLEE